MDLGNKPKHTKPPTNFRKIMEERGCCKCRGLDECDIKFLMWDI